MVALRRLSLGALLLPLLAATTCSSALAPLQSQWGPLHGPQGDGSRAFVLPSKPFEVASPGVAGRGRFFLGGARSVTCVARRAPAGVLLRPACREVGARGSAGLFKAPGRLGPRITPLRMADTRTEIEGSVEKNGAKEGSRLRATVTLNRAGPFAQARASVCLAVKSAGAAIGLPVDEWDKNDDSISPEVDEFVAEVDKEVSKWVKQVQEMEDANVDDIRDSLDAVYEQLSVGSSLQWSRQASAADRVMAWRRIRKLTDPSTKSLLISIEKIRYVDVHVYV